MAVSMSMSILLFIFYVHADIHIHIHVHAHVHGQALVHVHVHFPALVHVCVHVPLVLFHFVSPPIYLPLLSLFAFFPLSTPLNFLSIFTLSLPPYVSPSTVFQVICFPAVSFPLLFHSISPQRNSSSAFLLPLSLCESLAVTASWVDREL
jgi:hypothetical protein